MNLYAESQFYLMDQLSARREPFFFIIDFMKQKPLVFTPKDLEANHINIAFPSYIHHKIEPTSLPSTIVWQPNPEPLETFAQGFNKVQNHLKRGDSYLANYTRKTKVETNLNLEQIFLHTQAKYKILMPGQWVCFSPETFVEIQGATITTHPMKGTIDAKIPNAPEVLRQNIKEKAEHYTVVDLLRNDLSIVAHDVYVKTFQRIDYIPTQQKDLYAMSSEIVGKLKSEFRYKVGSLLKALLPAGSILGAPKGKTLQIVLDAEGYSRGFYTGVAGWFDGHNLDSCVLIRFIEQTPEGLFFKSGGGITHQSQLEAEYEEMKNKIYVPIY